jgi:hypothetical protein
VNRRHRRQARNAASPPAAYRAIAEAYRCPDCNAGASDVQPAEGGVYRIDVRHEPTCPWYRRHIACGPHSTA